MIPSSKTAALLPQPFPFLGCCCATGGDGLAPGFGFAGTGFAAAGFAGGFGGAGFEACAGAEGFGGGGDIVSTSIIRVLPPFATPAASSVGSNTVVTSPNRTVAPVAGGASPFNGSPSMKGRFVESTSTTTQTPSLLGAFTSRLLTH